MARTVMAVSAVAVMLFGSSTLTTLHQERDARLRATVAEEEMAE